MGAIWYYRFRKFGGFVMIVGFISAGFNPPHSLTLEELNFMRESDYIIVDSYTSPNFMKEFESKKLIIANREMLEDFNWIFELNGKVSIVSPGDITVATTHYNIYLEAVKRGINSKIYHNSTIFPLAATRVGLHVYKVGPPVSLPRFTEKFRPYSSYDKILRNFTTGLHTIILLDTDPPLSLKDALGELLEMESEKRQQLFTKETKLVVISNLGRESESILFGKIEELLSKDPEVPITLVLPSTLHFIEEEYLQIFNINK